MQCIGQHAIILPYNRKMVLLPISSAKRNKAKIAEDFPYEEQRFKESREIAIPVELTSDYINEALENV